MRKIVGVLGLGVGAVFAAPVQAADAPMYDKGVVEAPPPVYLAWQGFYAGIHGGYGGGDFEYPFSVGTFVAGEVETQSGGFFGGAQIGYNWQASPDWVLGVETDIAWSDIEDEVSISIVAPGFTTIAATAGTSVNYFGTIRVRAGYLVTPSALLYVTGGAAYGETESSLSASATGLGSFAASTSETDWGWTIGGGLEYRLNEAVSFKTEYLYVDLGDSNLYSTPSILGSGFPATLDLETSFHTVKAGLNYRFSL